jgi:exosortase D (VPLPA-CTERM-specific)
MKLDSKIQEPRPEPSAPRATGRVRLDAPTLWRGGLICLALLWLYGDVLRRLARDWWVDENYSHGFLVPLISGYLIWTNRDRLLAALPKPRLMLGGGLMLAAVAMLLAGTLGAELYLSRVSFLVALAALVVYFCGLVWLRLLVFPLGLFLLAIPIPAILFNQIAFPLQLIASDYATRAIGFLDIPALREGNVIELAQMKLQVVEACSGIRSLMALTTLAVTYAYFAETRWWRRLVLVAAVIPMAIIANAARVAGTGVMAHYWGAEAAEGFMHGFSGWLVFILALLMLLGLARLLSLAAKLFTRRPAGPAKADQFEEAPSASQARPIKLDLRRRLSFIAMLGSLLLAAAFTNYLTRESERERVPPRAPLSELPDRLGPWRQVETNTLDPATLELLKPDDYLSRTYANERGMPAFLFIAYYGSQRTGQTYHSPQNCLPGAGWAMVGHQRYPLGGDQVGQGEINQYLIAKGGEKLLTLYWYHGRGRVVASEYWGKVYTVEDAVFRRRTDGALVRVMLPVEERAGGEQRALEEGLNFVQRLMPELPRSIPD